MQEENRKAAKYYDLTQYKRPEGGVNLFARSVHRRNEVIIGGEDKDWYAYCTGYWRATDALVPRVIGQTEAIRQRRTGGMVQLQHTTKQEFLNNCPEGLRDFFTGAFSKSEELGMHILWGTKGFSLRSQDSKGNFVSLFYGFPPGVSGKDHVVVQGYVGDIDAKYMNQIRDRFLAVPGTTQGGDYTINLDLNTNTIDDAKKLLQVAWDTNKELQRWDTSKDI